MVQQALEYLTQMKKPIVEQIKIMVVTTIVIVFEIDYLPEWKSTM